LRDVRHVHPELITDRAKQPPYRDRAFRNAWLSWCVLGRRHELLKIEDIIHTFDPMRQARQVKATVTNDPTA
jgi:hypothetical protein